MKLKSTAVISCVALILTSLACALGADLRLVITFGFVAVTMAVFSTQE